MNTLAQKNCPYCHEKDSEHFGKSILNNSFEHCGRAILDKNFMRTALIHLEDGWHLRSWDYYDWSYWDYDYDAATMADTPVVACPMCGRPLGKEVEP